MILDSPEQGRQSAPICANAIFDNRIAGQPLRLLLLLLLQPRGYVVTPSSIAEDFPSMFSVSAARYALGRLHKAGYTTIVTDHKGGFVDRIIRDWSREREGFKRIKLDKPE